jgi:hypothetical protein
MPRLGPPQSGALWAGLRVKIKRFQFLSGADQRSGKPFLRLRGGFTRLRDANPEARRRHSPERAGRLATRNALRVGVKPEASPPGSRASA